MEKKASLTADEKLRAAHAHLINKIGQHHIAALYGVNPGRVNEAIMAVKMALEWPGYKNKEGDTP